MMTASDGTPARRFTIGEFDVLPDRNIVSRAGKEFQLEPKVMDVLCALAARPGEVIARDTLIDEIWRVEYGADESLTRAISLLRKTFREAGGDAEYIETVPKRGYRLAVPAAETTATPSPDRPTHRILAPAAVIAVLAVIAGAVFLTLDKPPATQGSPATRDATPVASIAVLPFADMSEAGDQEYFADGIAEELLNLIARETDLRVAARTSSFAFKGKPQGITEIAGALKVDALVEGSIRKNGGRVRITAQLVDARSGFHLWSEIFDRELADVIAVQEEIAGAIVAAIPSDAAKDTVFEPQRPTSTAYDLYLQGRHHLERRTPESIELARSLFERAVEADAEFAPAWAELGKSFVLLGATLDTYGDLSIPEVNALARPAIERALALDPELAEAHSALGVLELHVGTTEESVSTLERSVALNPSSSQARQWLHSALLRAGRFREAFEQIDRAAEIDPLSAIVLENLVNAHLGRGRFDDAIAVARRNVSLHPEWPVAHTSLGNALFSSGRYAEGAAADAVSIGMPDGGPGASAAVAFRFAMLKHFDEEVIAAAPMDAQTFTRLVQGRTEEARAQVLAELNHRSGDRSIVARVAWTLWAAGDDDAARSMFEDYAASADGDAVALVGMFDCYPGIYIAALRQRAGDTAGAQPLIEACRSLLQRQTEEGVVLPYFRTDIPAQLLLLEGRADEAIAYLHRLADERRTVSWWLGHEPMFAPIHDDPGFKEAVARITALVDQERERFLAPRDE